LTYIARAVFKTPLFDKHFEEAKRRLKFNLRLGPGPRPGIVIDSAGGGYGKSTFLQELMRWWIRHYVTTYGGGFQPSGWEVVPATYLTLDAGTTIKSMTSLFANFLNYPWKESGTSRNDRTLLIQNALYQAAVSLIAIDDLHFLKMNRQPDKLASEQLKKIASTVPATIVCAGINCLNSGLLWEGLTAKDRQWSQVAGRFMRIEVGRFRSGSAEWNRMLKRIGAELTLLKGEDDPLKGLSGYLFERSNGEIGTLVQLIREGVVEAIATGAEQLTEPLLDTITLSLLAEAEYEARRGRRASAAPKAPAE
jgi:hypothetical protein